MTDDLDTIDPPGNTIKFAGREVVIKPLTVGKLPAFSRAIKPILGAVEHIESIESITPSELLDLMAEHGENVVKCISIATGIAEAEINESDPVTLLTLVRPIIKANADFFRLRQVLSLALGQKLGSAASPGAGPTP
jgi:hypothetical protein